MSTLSGGPNVILDGLVLWLDAANTKSYVSGSTTWNDISRGGNNGTLVNGPTFNTGSGGSIVFDGPTDYVSTTFTQPTQDSGSSFTWNVWVYPTINANGQLIMGNRGGPELIFTKLTTNAFEYYPSGMNAVMPLNVWQNVCVVKSQTSILYYRNAQIITSITSLISKPTLPFYVGGDPTAGEYSASSISQVHIYNRALSSQEVLQNYNATKSRFNLT